MEISFIFQRCHNFLFIGTSNDSQTYSFSIFLFITKVFIFNNLAGVINKYPESLNVCLILGLNQIKLKTLVFLFLNFLK